MKHLLALIILLLAIQLSATAQETSVDSLFQEANTAYSMQDFAKAIELYQTIFEKEYKSSELYFNLGNAHYKLGQFAKAILFFEKADLLSPGDPDIEFNLKKAQAYTIDRIEVIPEFFLIVWIRSIISIFSSNTWAIIAIINFVLALLLFLFYFILPTRSKKVISFTLGIILFGLSLFSFSFALKTMNYIEQSKQAIVMTSTVTVKGSPDYDGVNVFIIHEGTKVFLIRSIGEWYEVKIADGKQGWLHLNDVELI